MKRAIGSLALMILVAGNLHAQETVENELELVRQLRLKGWNSLARERAEFLLKRGDATLNAALPIELARINISEARQKGPEQRLPLFLVARTQLQDFIAKNKGTAAAALASAELARLTSYHAQALLSTAMREENDKARHERARPAAAKFVEAGEELKKAIAALDAALKGPTTPPEKALLEKEHQQARFDAAINLYDQARTFIDKSKDAINFERAKTMGKAKDEFVKLRSDESTDLGWLANAWLMKVSMELTTPDDVNKYYEFIMSRKDVKEYQPGIQPAVRLVKYFALQDVTLARDDEPETIGLNAIAQKAKKKMSGKEQLEKVQRDGQAWLDAHQAYHTSFEGQGVLFEVAYAHYTEAANEKDKKLVDDHYDKAIHYFDKLAKINSDLGFRARQLSRQIKYRRLDPKAELRTFEEFMMKAEKERRSVIDTSIKLEAHAKKVAEAAGNAAKLAELAEAKKQIDANRKKHLKDVITSLTRAQSVTANVAEVDEARHLLCGAYLAYGDPYRGAIVAEALARARTSRSHEGAQTALHTYASLLAREPNNAVIRQRLQDMADFILSPDSQRNWKEEQVTSLAHYHLAMAVRDADPKKAIGHLEQIKPNFTDYSYTQAQLFFIAEASREKLAEAARDQGIDNKQEQKWFLDASQKAIQRMPKLKADDSPNVVTMYFFAKVEVTKHMYAEAIERLNANEELAAIKRCNEMAQYVKDLRSEFDNLKGDPLSKDHREQLEFTMQVMLKYADLGIAESKFRSDRPGRFDEVLEATKKVVADTLAKAAAVPKDEPIRMRDYRVTGDVLGLALRASVQKGDVDKGKAILDVLQRLAGTDGKKPGPIVAVLLNDIASQIDSMKKRNDTKSLAETKKNYTAFLDVIQKELESKGKGLDNNAALMLAHAFNSLDDPAKAAAMFAKVRPTVDLNKKFDKKKETDEEAKARQLWEQEVGRHWAVQIEYLRALRACKDTESKTKALEVVKTILETPNARFQIQAMMEKCLLLEDDKEKKYVEAYQEWGTILKRLQPNLGNPDVQKLYFTSFYEMTRVMFKMGAHDTRIKSRQKFIDAAANNIIRLENSKTKVGWEIAGPMFLKLFKDKDYEQLKKAYDTLKKSAALPAPARILASNDRAPALTADRRELLAVPPPPIAA